MFPIIHSFSIMSLTCSVLILFILIGGGNSIQVPGTSFLVGTASGVKLYSIDDLDHYDVIIPTNDTVVSVDYHLGRRLVFYYSNRTVYKTSMEPSVSNVVKTSTPIATTTGCDAIAVDWVFYKVLFCDNSTIMSMDLDGGESTVLYLSERKGLITKIEVDPLEGIVFWSVSGIIESYRFVGQKHFRGNLSDEERYVRTLALDMTAHRVYYLTEEGAAPALFSVNYQGAEFLEHKGVSQFGVTIGLGVVKGHIFWLTSDISAPDELYGAPLPLNGTENVQRLTSIARSVWHMKVVHPDLQKKLTVDAARTTPAPRDL